MIETGLILSITLNVLLFWYIAYALKKLLFVSENMGDLLNNMEIFTDHLEQIHSLETFYGDESLQSLIRHSREIVEEIKGYEEIYNLTTEAEEEGKEEEGEDDAAEGEDDAEERP